MALNINGRMKVKTLRADFKKEFGLALRVYDGRSFADDDATLASIRKGDSVGGEFSPQRNTKVGNLEDKIMDMFGIKTQVAGSDDSYLCENDYTLAKALEADEKLMVKREKRNTNSTSASSKDKEVISEDASQDTSSTDDMSVEEVIAKIKIVYKDNEYLEEIVDDLEGGSYFDLWAKNFITEDFGNNLELARALFRIAVERTEDYRDFNDMAKSIVDPEGLNDKTWARELYEKAAEKAEDSDDFRSLAESIADPDGLNDKVLAKELCVKAAEKAEDFYDFKYLADDVVDPDKLDDKVWAKELYAKAAEKAEDPDDFKALAESIADPEGLNDKVWAKELDEETTELTESNGEDITSEITISKIYFEIKDKKEIDTKEKLKNYLISFLTTAFHEEKEQRTTTGQLDFEVYNENPPEVEIVEERSLLEIEENTLLFLFEDSDICANITVQGVNNECPLKIEIEKLGNLEIIQNIQQECADINYDVEEGGDTRTRSLQIIAKDDEVLYVGYWDWGQGHWEDSDVDESIDDLLEPALSNIDEACDEIFE